MIAVSVAAGREWQIVLKYYNRNEDECRAYPFGFYFQIQLCGEDTLFYLTGTRKTNASAATQYIIDHFHPDKIIIMGTCAGIDPAFKIRDILLPRLAVQVDTTVKEIDQLIRREFSVEIDLAPYDFPYETGIIGSGDKAIVIWKDYLELKNHGITVADTESASIAYVCHQNHTAFVIIRGISDFPHNISFEEASSMNSVQIRSYLSNVPLIIEDILRQYLEKIILAGRMDGR